MKTLNELRQDALSEIAELEVRLSKVTLMPVEKFEVAGLPFKVAGVSNAEENKQNQIDSLNSQIEGVKIVFAETVLYGEADNLGIG